ncbi:hypothetical protein N7474_000426 [Penicillium riverlandense]|uniref:uncharacterized protein n=1 Tax=Penicillium riverlandense TaxID=1903569 RepID=UPI002546D651|nr:uncharacterized protein N7474_000426 [Penicillium riverlandense]KAJ5832115.1 hypothetical protein N7474_000426 [Penicillium riverlandense]
MLRWVYPVRIVQTLLALAVVGLTAYVIASLHDSWSFSKTVDYMLFAGCWTGFVAVPYLEAAPLFFPRVSHELVIPFVEIVTSMIWFAGFIALGVLIPSPSECVFETCHALQAVVVLSSVQWALFAVTNVYAVLDLVNSRRKNTHQNTADAEAPPVSEVNAEQPVA